MSRPRPYARPRPRRRLSALLCVLAAALALLLTPAMAPAALAEGEVTRDELLDALHDYFNGGDREQVEAVVDSYFNFINPPGNPPQQGNVQGRGGPPGDGGVQGAEGPVQGQGTGTTFVSNTGQTTIGGSLIVGTLGSAHVSLALAFTTGVEAVTLSEVQARLAFVAGSAGVVVTVWSTTASGLPSSKLYDLTNPSSFTSGNSHTFTAPANSTLAATTTYAVVFENTVAGFSNSYELTRTTSNNEDSGATAGWSIANNRAERDGNGPWSLKTVGTEKPLIAIRGTQQSPSIGGGGTVYPGPWITPKPHHVKVASARTLIVTMDQRVELDANYSRSQLAGHFSVHFNGVAVGVNDAYVGGGGYEVHLGLTANAPRNQKLAVNYSSGPLLDATDANRRPISGFGYYGTGRFITPKPHAVERTWRTVTVYMDKAVQLAPGYTNAQLASAFLVRVDGVRYTPISARLTGGWGHPVELILAPHTDPGGFDEPTREVNMAVEYTKDPNGTGPLQESAYSGNQVESFGHYGRTSPTE